MLVVYGNPMDDIKCVAQKEPHRLVFKNRVCVARSDTWQEFFEPRETYPLRSKDQRHISPRIIQFSVDDYFLIRLHSLYLMEMAVSLGVSIFTILK